MVALPDTLNCSCPLPFSAHVYLVRHNGDGGVLIPVELLVL